MPVTSFPVSGTLTDVDGSTAVASANVYVWSFTNDETVSCTTNSSGEYSLDLANMSTQWASGDVLYIYAKVSGKSAMARAVIGNTDAYWEVNLYCRSGDNTIDDSDLGVKQKMRLISLSYTSAGAGTVSIVEKKSDIQMSSLNVSANGTTTDFYGKPGLLASNGFWVLKATQGTFKNSQTVGTANAIGDTTSNKQVQITYSIAGN